MLTRIPYAASALQEGGFRGRWRAGELAHPLSPCYGYPMLEFLIAIGFNVFVAALTALLIYFVWTRKRSDASLADASAAMGLYPRSPPGDRRGPRSGRRRAPAS